MSGLSRTPGKRVRGKTLRGFESRLLRQQTMKYAPSGAFFLCVPTKRPTMTLGEYLGVSVAAVGVISATLVGLAHAGDQGRKWFKSTSLQLLAAAFYIFSIAGAVWTVWSFAVQPGTPSRAEILSLLTWIFNGGSAISFAVTDLLKARRRNPQPE